MVMASSPDSPHALPLGSLQDAGIRAVSVPIDSLDQAVMIADASGRILAVNPAFSAITGFANHEVLAQNPRILKSGRHGEAFYAEFWGRLLHTGSWQGEIWNRRKDGSLFPAWQTISVVRAADGAVSRFISVFSDIAALKSAEAQWQHAAHHDPLTGLPNRLRFTIELDSSLRRAQRHGQKVALLFIDLDGFKAVNDTLGHLAGDQLLRTVAARLREGVRREDAVARWGGDEFTIVLEEVADADAAAEAVRKLHEVIAQPVLLGTQAITVPASIGVALYPDHGSDGEALVRAADEAMYRGKLSAARGPAR
jgi:diguanylate cyclase (GGDEF)-like protein/PAS domain S-box-containing protein